jgi:hypothetical protein
MKEFIFLYKNYNFDAIQIPMSIINQSFDNAQFKKIVKKKKIFVEARSIFMQGLIFMKDKEINKKAINEYWSKKEYNLEIPSILGNCTLCFMKGKNAVISILSSYPELADEWIKDEEQNKKGYTYFNGISIKQLRDIAKNNLFKDYDLNEIKPAFDCACTN